MSPRLWLNITNISFLCQCVWGHQTRCKNISHATRLRLVTYFFFTMIWSHPCVIRGYTYCQVESLIFFEGRNSWLICTDEIFWPICRAAKVKICQYFFSPYIEIENTTYNKILCVSKKMAKQWQKQQQQRKTKSLRLKPITMPGCRDGSRIAHKSAHNSDKQAVWELNMHVSFALVGEIRKYDPFIELIPEFGIFRGYVVSGACWCWILTPIN